MFATSPRPQDRDFRALYVGEGGTLGGGDSPLFRTGPASSFSARSRQFGDSVTARLTAWTGSRRRAKISLFALLLLGFFCFALLVQDAEQRAIRAVIDNESKQALPTLAPSLSGNQSADNNNDNNNNSGGAVVVPVVLTPTPTYSPTLAAPLSDRDNTTVVPPTGDASSLNNTTQPALPQPAKNETVVIENRSSSSSMTSFYASILFSFLTWMAILQMIRYLRQRPFRAQSQALLQSQSRRQREIEMLQQFLLLSHVANGGGDPRRWRLALLQRDFTGEDYEMLQQLDEIPGASRHRGASQGLISQLPTHKISAQELSAQHRGTSASSNTESEQLHCCNICLAPYEAGEEVRTLPCLHRFHSDCIDPWLRSNAVCPVCKHSVLENDEEQGEEGRFV